MSDLIERQAATQAALEFIVEYLGGAFDEEFQKKLIERMNALPSAQPEQQHGRIFQEIVVEYPSISTYPEYKGKPYFSIKYTENGQEFIGYGTYKPEVLSEYLKEYFMPSAQPEQTKMIKEIREWINSGNRGSADYFIVDKIEEIINKYE